MVRTFKSGAVVFDFGLFLPVCLRINFLGTFMDSEVNNIKSQCAKHPEHYAFVDRLDVWLCYECAYGRSLCEKKIGKDFDKAGGHYAPGGAGYAGD